MPRTETWVALAFVIVCTLVAWNALSPVCAPDAPFVRVNTSHPQYELVLTLKSPRSLGNPPRILEYQIQIQGVYGCGHHTEVIKTMTLREDASKSNPLFRKAGCIDPDLRVAVGVKGSFVRGSYHVRIRAKNGAGYGPVHMQTVELDSYQQGLGYRAHAIEEPSVFILR